MNSGDLKSFVESRRNTLVCLVLATATFALYWQVSRFEFTNSDELTTIVQNPFVLNGLTWQGLWWALTTSWFDFWHPLTWLSHMLDCELFGLNPGWHHMVGLGCHVANTLVLFAVLRRMTGALGRSAMVAALFALHPLHVESVAWVAERKDVLSAFFFLLTLWAYARYAEVQGPKSKIQRLPSKAQPGNTPSSSSFYLLSLFFFALGLMSKAMVVTLPFVLLLLDCWPLHRLELSILNSQPSINTPLHHSITPLLRLLREKLPFFTLALASSAITYSGMKNGHRVLSAEKIPWGLRLSNAIVSYVRYLGKMIWPADLAPVYPMPNHWAGWQVGGAVLVLLLISLFLAFKARSAPYGIVGWLIFLGSLVPVIGIVAMSLQSMADRYTYIPSIGIFITVVWGIADWSARWKRRTVWRSGAAVLVLAACGWLTWVQARCWRTDYTLWTHCVAVYPDSFFARYNLGCVLQHSNRTSEAIEQYRAALRLNPDHVSANLNLGIALLSSSRAQEATNYLGAAMRLRPDYAKAQGAMGLALLELGDYSGAVACCAEAIRLDPAEFGPYVDMGRALSGQGKSDEALSYYAEGLRLDPRLAQTHYYLGLEWMKRGNFEQAAASFGEALRLVPDWPEARAAQQRALEEIRQPKINSDLPR
jgi:Tfp pilus assembly protein PilF